MNSTQKKVTRFSLVAPLALVLVLMIGSAHAEIYKWVDDQGSTHFTDNLFNVPQQYLYQLKTYEERTYDNTDEIPMTKSSIGYIVKAKVNGVGEVRLLLDTGANITVINPEALLAANVSIPQQKDVRIKTAGGEVQAAAVKLVSLSVGPHKKSNIMVVAHDALDGVDGLLGMDFLDNYKFEILTAAPALKLTTK